MPKKEHELTVQQEADLAQSANEWVNVLIKKKLIDPFQFVGVAAIIAQAMRDTAIGQMKDLKLMGETLIESRDHLKKLAAHSVKLEARGIELSKLLTLSNAITDEAAKALDLLSRQDCDCPQKIHVEHTEGCSKKFAQDALDAIKVMMETIDA